MSISREKGLFVIAAVVALLGCHAYSAPAGPSSPLDRLQQYQGKIVVLNFWASWCKPCLKEMPMLMDLQRELESRGVQFIGASTDKENDRAKAEAFVRETKIGYPIWFGLSDVEMKSIYLGDAIPATAVFDRNGAEVFRLIGEIKKKELLKRLEWLLGSRESKPPKELLLPLGVSAKPYRKP